MPNPNKFKLPVWKNNFEVTYVVRASSLEEAIRISKPRPQVKYQLVKAQQAKDTEWEEELADVRIQSNENPNT